MRILWPSYLIVFRWEWGMSTGGDNVCLLTLKTYISSLIISRLIPHKIQNNMSCGHDYVFAHLLLMHTLANFCYPANLDEHTWWRNQMETFSALLAICAGNSPVIGALVFSLICARINARVYNSEAGDLRRQRAHYDITVMTSSCRDNSPIRGLGPPSGVIHG